MATEHFCLRWNNHQSTLVSVFDNLLESGTLVDCTLAADGRYLKAHKVVLSACSPYLGMILSQHYDKHPIIILKDVKYDELKAMLDYMYRGEVNISQEQLSTFLKAAESLQIKGLTDTGGDEGSGLVPNRPPSSSSTASVPNDDPPSPAQGDGGSPGPRKRKRVRHDEPPDCEMKPVTGDSDRLAQSAGNSGSPGSASAGRNVGLGSVKREPTEEGEGQAGVGEELGESGMMARPGPSNGGGTNNKGSPWILSTDSTGDEMQLTAGQGSSKETHRVVEARVNLDTTTFQQKEVTASGPSLTEGTVNISLAENCELNNKKTDQSANGENQKKLCSNKGVKQVAAAIYNQQEIKEELIIPDILDENSPSQAKAYDKEVDKRIQDFLSDRIWADHDNPAEDPLSTSDLRNVEGPEESGSEGVMAGGNRSRMVNSSKESALSVDSIDGKTTRGNTSKELTTRYSTITIVDIDQRMIDPAKQLETKDNSSSTESFESVQTRQSKRIQEMKNKPSTNEDLEHVRLVSRNKDPKSREDLDNLRQAIRKQDLKSMQIKSRETPFTPLLQSRNQDILLRKSGPSTKEFVMSKRRLINNRLVLRQQEQYIADLFKRQVTKYRRILPSTKEASSTNIVDITDINQDKEDAEGKDDVNQQGSSNQATSQTGVQNQAVTQQIPTGPYISFGTQMQPSSSMQSVSIPMQQQFSMSSPQGQTNLNQSLKSMTVQQPNIQPSTAQGNQLHLIQPQFAFSTPQIRATSVTNHGGNIQPLSRIVQPQQPINSQNLVINQSAQPFAMSQPVFVTSGMVADTTSQFVPSSVLSSSGTPNPVFYLKTDQGLVRMP